MPWTIPGRAVGLAVACSVPGEQQTKPFYLVLWELQQYEDRGERRWTGLGVGVGLLHRYWSESGEIGTRSVLEGVFEYCEDVVQENEDGHRVL